MTFLAPLLLLGLPLVPALVGLYLVAQRRRSRYAVRFTNVDLLANLVLRRPAWRRHLPAAIYLGAVALLVIGLARPVMAVAVPREDATVVLAIDVSGSMKATDVAPTRLGAARDAAKSFIDQLPEGIRVGIVAFASRPVTLVTPTTDHAQLNAALDSLEPVDGSDNLAHLVLVPNTEHHPYGDFFIDQDGRVHEDHERRDRRLTFSGISVLHRNLFAGFAAEPLPLVPLLSAAMTKGKVSGEAYDGIWVDIGTPARLRQLNDIVKRRITE